MAVTGLVSSPVFGSLVDRFGPRIILLISILIEATATALWSVVHDLKSAYLVATLSAIGNAGIWPPQTTMMARMVDEDDRPKLFGLQFMMLNLGLGLGGLISSTIVRVEEPHTFTQLYVLDACSYLLYFAFIFSLRGIGGKLQREPHEKEAGSYREMLHDKRLVRLSLISILLMTAGYASMDAGMPALLTTYGGLTVSHLGPVWAVNTAVVVLLQIFMLKKLEGKSRTRLFTVVGILWSISWLVLGLGMTMPGMMFAMACISTGIFAIGETVWSPVGSALQNAIAPEHMRGRYNAVGALVWVIAGTIGPALSGVMLDRGLALQWLLLIAAAALMAGYLGQSIRKLISDKEDGLLENS
jgi:MFS family permease